MAPLAIKCVIVDDDDFDAEASLNGMRVGYANCDRNGARLQLLDICVFDEIGVQHTGPFRWFNQRFAPKKRVRLRRRGIGSALLQRVIDAAETAGVEEIWGWVSRDAVRTQPTLLAWYERHGFSIFEPDSECNTRAEKKIVRKHSSMPR